MRKLIPIISAAVAVCFIAATVIITARSENAAPPLAVSYTGSYTTEAEASDSLININTADLDALCSLPGIGEATAGKIIAYREENGPFSDISDIIDVKGIGLKTFEGFRDKITV